ncbi:hypothetical protein KQX54_009328 [Cotesia glomerata]|uniref:Uncharacterized protein n=1 Tax=Cotesia glomerata TaxID=32391 RepID=A0AAV7IEA6_COTGL|nr:hypothetical protein KQX54_009328 [Cotesia glomerata]
MIREHLVVDKWYESSGRSSSDDCDSKVEVEMDKILVAASQCAVENSDKRRMEGGVQGCRGRNWGGKFR